MDIIERSPTEAKWIEALQQMQYALDLLDCNGAPADIGSHLDLAICRLEHSLGHNPADNTIQQLQREIESALGHAPGSMTKSDILVWPSQPGTSKSSDSDSPLMFR